MNRTIRRVTAAALVVLSSGCATARIATPIATGGAGAAVGYQFDPPWYVDGHDGVHRRWQHAAIGAAVGTAVGLAVVVWLEYLTRDREEG